MSEPNDDEHDKILRVLRCGLALLFAATLLLSSKLWLTTRDYPLSPVWNGWPQPRFPLDHLLFFAMILAILGAGVLRAPRLCLWIVGAIGAFWALGDQRRWSLSEMRILPYPEDRVALHIARTLAHKMRHGAVQVIVRGKPRVLTGQRSRTVWSFPPVQTPD